MSDAIELEVELPLVVERAWQMFADPRHLARWFGSHIRLDVRPGGAFREVWEDRGRQILTTGLIDRCTPPTALSWTWSDKGWPAETRVSLTLEPVDAGTRLKLVHAGWSQLPDADRPALHAAHLAGWRMHLRNLMTYVAEGIASRPPGNDVR